MFRSTLLLLVTLAGCTRGANLPATLIADDGEAIFDTVEGAVLSRRTFGFTNIGDSTTAPLTVQLTGDTRSFAVDWDGCTGKRLSPDDHCQVVVRLDGIIDGAFDGELHVFGEAAPQSASVTLHGKVLPTNLTLTADMGTSIDATQGQFVGLRFNVYNAGGVPSGPLHVTTTSLPFDQLQTDCEGAVLVGGDRCSITIGVGVALDAPVGSSWGTIDVTGTPGGHVAVIPTLVVHAGGQLVTSDVDWGIVPSLQEQKRDVVLRNPGSLESGALKVMLTGDPVFRIASDGCTGQSLAMGRACTVTLALSVYDSLAFHAALAFSAPNLSKTSSKQSATGKRAHWTMRIGKAGNGTGAITIQGATTPPITDGSVYAYPNGGVSSIFVATPDAGSTFTGWSGSAPCSGTGTCGSFGGSDNTDYTLTATFTK